MFVHEFDHLMEGDGLFEPDRKDHVQGIVSAGGDPGADDSDAQFFLFLLQRRTDLRGVYESNADLAVRIRIVTDAEPMHDQLDDDNKGCDKKRHAVHSGTAGHSDSGHGPDTGGGGKSLDGVSVFKDHSGAKEGYAGDHLRRDAGGVSPPGPFGKHACFIQQVGKAVFGDDHDQSRRTGNDAVGTDPCFLGAFGSLQPDDGAAKGGRQDTDQIGQQWMYGKKRLNSLNKLCHSFSLFLLMFK